MKRISEMFEFDLRDLICECGHTEREHHTLGVRCIVAGCDCQRFVEDKYEKKRD